jgi:excisionase family DNA binding protein
MFPVIPLGRHATPSCRRFPTNNFSTNHDKRQLATRKKRVHDRSHPSRPAFVESMEDERMAIEHADSRDAPEGGRPLAVSVKAACQIIGVGNTTMWSLIKEGRLKTVQIGRRRLIIYASLRKLLNLEDEAES